ncbi:MAG TPA: hypothetical protein VFU12_18105 [Glycomyces sp.]|nr:hypothetical protein [Glycomyces sp.]
MSYPPQPPYGQGGPPPPQYGGGQPPPPYGQPPPMPPGVPMPPPRRGLPGGMIVFLVVAAGVLVITATALVLPAVFFSEEAEPGAIGTETTGAPEETEDAEPAPSETEAPTTEAAPSGGGSYTAVGDLCAVMEPIVAGYMAIDADETEETRIGDAVTCTMAGEMSDVFDRPFVSVTQDVDKADAEGGIEQYGYHSGVRSGCDIEEGVLPDFAESAHFHGGDDTGCVIIGHVHAVNAADGNMFLSADVSYSSESSLTGGEEQLVIDLVTAVAAAS